MGGGLAPGCRPAPAVVPAAGRQDQHQKLAIRGMAGWGPVAAQRALTPMLMGSGVGRCRPWSALDVRGPTMVGRYPSRQPGDSSVPHLGGYGRFMLYGHATHRTSHSHGTDPGRHHLRGQILRARGFTAVGEEHSRCA
ncbi:hypothetical protein B7H26_01180 [Stenotrophomonas maltophilia]|nr:hypothetical protein B7H26_01180 [Stenotrophomonas maltophilia]